MNDFLFSGARYGEAVAPLLEGIARFDLRAARCSAERESRLRALTLEDLGQGVPPRDSDSAKACLAGLWLLHGFLDASHGISQELASADGSYWHGIMHRCEGDYGNAKYWFRQTGNHAIHSDLAREARSLLESATEDRLLGEKERSLFRFSATWDPHQFVDLVAHAVRAGSPAREICEKIAWTEWCLLFDHCHREAFGVD